MNTKTKRILKKIALMVMVIAALAMVLSSCSSNTAIDTSKTPEQWKDTKVNTEASTDFIDVILSGIGTFLGWITTIMPANSYILTLFVFGVILDRLDLVIPTC